MSDLTVVVFASKSRSGFAIAPLRALAFGAFALLIAACAPMTARDPIAATSPQPVAASSTHNPAYAQTAEINQTALLACDGNTPVTALPATAQRGRVEIRCIQSYTDNPALLEILKLDSLLLVLDIDDTLLTSDTYFGSDRWYEWQSRLPDGHADKVSCLFDVIALNYEAGTQHAVEEKGAKFINGLKVPKLLLTSRSAYARGGTERELLNAKYDFPINLMSGTQGRSWINVRSNKPAPISYANGIQMVTGRDKGQSLLDLLGALERHYDNVVLIDDGERNIDSLRQALPAVGVNYYGIHYKGVDKSSSEDDKKEARAAWALWGELIEKGYATRWARWGEKDGKGCGK